MTTPSSYTTFRYISPANMQTYIYEPWSTDINLGHSQEKTLNHFPWNQSSGNGTESASAFLVCFTDPLSLSFSPQLSPCFQPLNKSYPQLLSPSPKGKGFPFSQASPFWDGGGFSFLIVRWLGISFWFIEYWFQKGVIKVDYSIFSKFKFHNQKK